MQSDAEFLGLTETGPGRYSFTVERHLARIDGYLYGGTAIGVSLVAAELVSGRAGVWMTTQFVATAPPGAEVSVHAEVLKAGRRITQVRVTGTDESGDTMFASLGSTGDPNPDGLEGTFEQAPVVAPPEESEDWSNPFVSLVRAAGLDVEIPPIQSGSGFTSAIEFRLPEIREHPDPVGNRLCAWVRRHDRRPVTPAVAAYMADMVPLAVAHASRELAGGLSLDNSIRLGRFEESEWVLLDLRPHFVTGDHGHGLVHIWSQTGQLMATASQSTSMFRVDITNPPWARRS